MVAQGRGGRIVGACSIASKRGMHVVAYNWHDKNHLLTGLEFLATAGMGAYGSSKFAIRGLTQSTGGSSLTALTWTRPLGYTY